MKIDLYREYKIKYAAVLPLSACEVKKPYLLEREGLPANGDGSVLLFLLPYYTAAGEGGNVSMYAAGRDYHAVFRSISDQLLNTLRRLAPDAAFAAFADHSPIDEKSAAAISSLGVIGCHSLLINPEYSSFVFIGGIYSSLNAGEWLGIADGITFPAEHRIKYCQRCGECVRACPSASVRPEGGIDPDRCLSTISQKKRLTEKEEEILASAPFVWGCDVCQLACPVTKKAIERGTIYTPIDAFRNDVVPELNERTLDSLISTGEFSRRAYAWRGEETIRRNLIIKTRTEVSMIKEAIITAVTDAGRAILAAHDIESGILVKEGDDNFATAWDIETQRRLVASLSEIVPDAVFLAEEDADASAEDSAVFTDTVPADGFCFVVDPIDGTTNFIHGMSHSAVSVALIKDSKTVFGCVYNPYLDECFYAAIGGGAYLRRAGADTMISVSSRSLADALVGFGTTPYDKSRADATFSLVCGFFRVCRDVRRGGSAALDVCYVAAGRYDVFFELSLSPWDFAAAALILREAGGILTNLDGGELAAVEKSSVLATNRAARAAAAGVLAQTNVCNS